MRLTLVWAAVAFVLVAASDQQRWRYHLPFCVPVALLLAAALGSLPWRRRSAVFIAVWIVVAAGLVVGQTVLTTRQRRVTDWHAIAQEAAKIPGPLYALEAPEIVFEFYLRRPVLPTPDQQTFARQSEARYLLAPERKVPQLLASTSLREVADGRVAGRRFVLLRRE
jgi:hypothetical protein